MNHAKINQQIPTGNIDGLTNPAYQQLETMNAHAQKANVRLIDLLGQNATFGFGEDMEAIVQDAILADRAEQNAALREKVERCEGLVGKFKGVIVFLETHACSDGDDQIAQDSALQAYNECATELEQALKH